MNTKLLWVVGILVVLIAILGFAKRSGYGPVLGSPTPSVTPAPGSSGTPVARPKTTGVATSTRTYTDLVIEYANRRIQFNQYCQASPSNMTIKSGTSIMLDNRSGDARTIKVGDQTFQFSGYGYRILTLSSPVLPKTLMLSCGSAVNVGQILLQK